MSGIEDSFSRGHIEGARTWGDWKARQKCVTALGCAAAALIVGSMIVSSVAMPILAVACVLGAVAINQWGRSVTATSFGAFYGAGYVIQSLWNRCHGSCCRARSEQGMGSKI